MKKEKVEPTIPTQSARSIVETTKHIQSLKGEERKRFCQTLSSEEKKEYLKCLKDMESETVKGTYRCLVPLGGSVKFSAKLHDGEVLTYEMNDGEEYEVPLWVANHLRDNCWFPENSNVLDAAGNNTIAVGKKHATHNFEPSGFFNA